ncbi:MAG TPA: enoyl-CoA hydratase-related protein [Polyangiaceae bacterium]|nr:enoyl-CoA hydratase-related protein [Polyangiaceae bacterium]
MDETGLRITLRDNVAILTLCREGRMNALSRSVLGAFLDAKRQLSDDVTLRAVIVTGAGERAFCAGADLKERQLMTEAEVREQVWSYRDCLGWLDDFPVPVIAAINGAALGGGLELALLCDLRVAVIHAQLGLPETGLGIIPAAGGTQRLPRLVGEAKAKQMILLNERLSAAEALSAGLIHRVSPEGSNVLEDTWQWIAPIREGAPIAQRAALAAVDAARELSLAEGLERELQLYEECLNSEDRKEALRAFAEKRKAVFSGR